MIDELDLTRIHVLILINQHVIIGARDPAPICLIGGHCLDDQRHHVGEVDGASGAQGRLVDLEIPDSLDQYVVVSLDRGFERGGIEQALLGRADDLEDILFLVPPHSAGRENAPLFRGIPQLEPFG